MQAGYVIACKESTGGLAILGLMIFAPIILLGDLLFAFALGEKWTTADEFAQILGPFLFFLFIQGPSGATFVVLQQQHILMKIQFMTILLTTGVFLASFAYGLEANATVAFFSTTSSMMSIIIITTAISISADHIIDSST
jgi:O-antigen/teichoic acid export membrane protein